VTPQDGSDAEDAGDATARLEAALERIARAAATGIIRAGRAGAAADERHTEVAARLDAIIARLRGALGAS
jgi:hypothetical protein